MKRFVSYVRWKRRQRPPKMSPRDARVFVAKVSTDGGTLDAGTGEELKRRQSEALPVTSGS